MPEVVQIPINAVAVTSDKTLRVWITGLSLDAVQFRLPPFEGRIQGFQGGVGLIPYQYGRIESRNIEGFLFLRRRRK